MNLDHVLAAFTTFIMLCLAGILWWIRKAQQHFDRLDHATTTAALDRYHRQQATPPPEEQP